MLKRVITEDIKGKIRGLKVFKSMDGCVFDYPEDAHTLFEEIVFNDKLHGLSYTLSKAEELPELLETDNGYNSNNNSGRSFGNNSRGGDSRGGNFNSNSSYNGNRGGDSRGGNFNSSSSFNGNKGGDSRSRTDRLDIFVGNLSSGADSQTVVNFLQSNKIDTSDVEVRMVNDKETGQFKGFGFISCYDKTKYSNILLLGGKSINGRTIRINDAATKSK